VKAGTSDFNSAPPGGRHCGARSPSSFRQRLSQTEDSIPGLPLIAFFEQLDALEALQNVPFGAERFGGAKTTMLRHN
jgi:hypothetical protein